MSAPRDPERLLDGLNDAQREAVTLTRGPLAIIAGAGSGKTRVISHRAAYAIETGVVPADRILLVTFTEKAAGEMVERMAALGHRGVAARTFHAHALSQLRHYWPSRHGGETSPRILSSKVELLYPLARRLPGHYKFTSPKDLADAIEWAKIRRIEPTRWLTDGGDRAPIPADLFARLYADYERTKARAGVLDFEDMLVETVRLLEQDEAAAATVRERKTWFSVDEYQDTNTLAERLLELWLGESRDLAVVGDPDQTIYSFTGATPDFLLGFERRHSGARIVALVENYRSSPEVLAFANRLVAPGLRGALQATLPAGPAPTIRRFVDDAAERVAIVGGIQLLLGEGFEPGEIAILVRINAQLPELEQALTHAAIPFRVRGQRFFDRREVRDARQLLRRPGPSPRGKAIGAAAGAALAGAIRSLFQERLGLGAAGAGGAGGVDGEPTGDEGRERAASLELIVRMVEDLVTSNPAATVADVLAELDRRDGEEASGSTTGVNLLTYHRAKGLEWDAVFLPALEEGLLPIRQAKEPDAVDEERRLLYVGITRARRHLALSWAARRTGQAGKEANRKPSRFLDALEPARTGSRYQNPGAATRRIAALEPLDAAASVDDAAERRLLEALQVWRRDRARADAVPAYVVAHDAMLFAIAEARPESITALARVKGIGPAKLDRYGSEILEIVTRPGPGA
ncbi:MAG TPA: ATP-dependent DNA helicase UvrD2 [Candidatus Limnocylindria bacterium]|nr:ATP-dependent DNA helicase UvrD2 [Candidatus Limnocylindria bacterium]